MGGACCRDGFEGDGCLPAGNDIVCVDTHCCTPIQHNDEGSPYWPPKDMPGLLHEGEPCFQECSATYLEGWFTSQPPPGSFEARPLELTHHLHYSSVGLHSLAPTSAVSREVAAPTAGRMAPAASSTARRKSTIARRKRRPTASAYRSPAPRELAPCIVCLD